MTTQVLETKTEQTTATEQKTVAPVNPRLVAGTMLRHGAKTFISNGPDPQRAEILNVLDVSDLSEETLQTASYDDLVNGLAKRTTITVKEGLQFDVVEGTTLQEYEAALEDVRVRARGLGWTAGELWNMRKRYGMSDGEVADRTFMTIASLASYGSLVNKFPKADRNFEVPISFYLAVMGLPREHRIDILGKAEREGFSKQGVMKVVAERKKTLNPPPPPAPKPGDNKATGETGKANEPETKTEGTNGRAARTPEGPKEETPKVPESTEGQKDIAGNPSPSLATLNANASIVIPSDLSIRVKKHFAAEEAFFLWLKLQLDRKEKEATDEAKAKARKQAEEQKRRQQEEKEAKALNADTATANRAAAVAAEMTESK